MGENQYFQEALGDFVHEAAYGGAVRHLTDRGYTVRQIVERLDFPAPYEKVRRLVWERLKDTGVILTDEPGSGRQRERFSYVKEYDRNGKPTFRRVPDNQEEAARVCWREETLDIGRDVWAQGLPDFLERKLEENGEDYAYVSCDFGRTAAREPGQYERMLEVLEGEREYVEGLPWERAKVYHRLNLRMREILVRLALGGLYQGEIFFVKTGDRIQIAGNRSFPY